MKITRTLKSSFLAGLVLVLPLAITLFILKILFNWTVGIVNPVVRGTRLAQYTANIELVAQFIAIGVIVVTITLLGLLVKLETGRRVLDRIGGVVDFIPLFRTIYGSVRQVASSFSDRSGTYESVVFVEYPRDRTYAVGFVTGDAPEELRDREGQSVYNVYLPASPNPTAGKLAMVPEDRIHESDLSVRQGIRLLMTTGTATTGEELEAAETMDTGDVLIEDP